MSSGGSKSTTTAATYTDPVNGQTFDSSAALNAEIQKRERDAHDKTELATDNGRGYQLTNQSNFDQDLINAQTTAARNAKQYFIDQGYDPSLFDTQLRSAVDAASGTINNPYIGAGTDTTTLQRNTPAINSAFSPNLGAQILSSANSGYQSQAANKIAQAFAPTYSRDQISDSWLSPAVDSVLTSQFDPLSSQLTNAQKRGTLNDTGYAAALKALSNDKTTATSTVNRLGQGVLSSDRSSLDDYITGAKNDASKVDARTYGSFNPDSYVSGANNLVDNYKTNFGGDLSNAVGNTSFSDITKLLNAGGVVQGATDPTATNPVGIGDKGAGVSDAYIAQQALANTQRGLGSTGDF